MNQNKSTPNPYSVSQLKLFDLCPLRYRYQYIDRSSANIQYIESFVGCQVHEVLRHLHEQLMDGHLPPIAELVTYYRRIWEQEWHREVRITNEQYGREWYRRYGEKCIRRYYNTHYPFEQPGIETIGLEWSFHISLQEDEAERYRMRGQIDRLSKCEDGSYIVHDYKTGQYVPSIHKLFKDLQPAVYQLAVHMTFPESPKVSVSWHYVSCQRSLHPNHSDTALQQLRERLIQRIDTLQSTTQFEAKPSPACRWCNYQERCPSYQDQNLRLRAIRSRF